MGHHMAHMVRYARKKFAARDPDENSSQRAGMELPVPVNAQDARASIAATFLR